MITIHLNNNTHFNICLSPKFIVFFRNIILNLMEVFNYLESIIIKDKEKNILVKAFNENWEDLEPETDYTLHGKKQILEKNNWENPNTDIDIDKNEIDSDDKILLKIIDQDFLFKIHKSEYTLEFTPKGVNVKKGNKIFDNLTISDGTYQEGKVIEIENDETKNIVSVILIKNTDTQSSINLYCLDLINNKIDLIDEFKIPRIKDYSFHMVDKNEKKELIILLSCEFSILLFLYKFNISYKSNNVDYDLKFGSRIKTQKTFPKFNPDSICPLRAFKKDDELFVKNKVLSEFFLAYNEKNIKILTYNEEGDIILIGNVKFIGQKDFTEENNIKRIEQFDQGIISAHLNDKKLNCYLFLNEKI